MSESLIGQVPDAWQLTTLGELCRSGGGSVQTGPFGSQLHASDYVPVGIPSVMPQNIGDNIILEQGIARISSDDATRLSRYLLREGDIVYSRRGDVERRALVRASQDGWLCGTGCLRVRVGKSADSRFISYYLGHPEVRKWIVRHAVGATMPNLNTAILSGVPVALPPLYTQRSIADVLTALDDKIALNDRITTTAEQLAIVVAHGRGHGRVSLAELVQLTREQVTPARLNVASVSLYSIPAFDKGRLPERVVPQEIKSSKLQVTSGTVLVAKLNPRTPRVWLVGPESSGSPALASTEFLALQPSSGLEASAIWVVCGQSQFWEDLAGKATGTSNSHQRVKPADLLATEVIDPRSFNAETRQLIDSLHQRATQSRLESQGLAELRDALLPGLMSGKIRVRDAEQAVDAAT